MVRQIRNLKTTKHLFKTCKGCGGSFLAKRKTQVYCNDGCRQRDYDRNYFHPISALKICPNCGEEFSTNMPYKQTYCGEPCRIEVRMKKYRGEALSYMDAAIESMLKVVSLHPEGPRGKKGSLDITDKLGKMGYKTGLSTSPKISAAVRHLTS